MKTDQSDLLASRYTPQCSTELLPESIRSPKKLNPVLGCLNYSLLLSVLISVASKLTSVECLQATAPAFTLVYFFILFFYQRSYRIGY